MYLIPPYIPNSSLTWASVTFFVKRPTFTVESRETTGDREREPRRSILACCGDLERTGERDLERVIDRPLERLRVRSPPLLGDGPLEYERSLLGGCERDLEREREREGERDPDLFKASPTGCLLVVVVDALLSMLVVVDAAATGLGLREAICELLVKKQAR